MNDLISRQDAINELEKLAFEMERWAELFQIQAKGVLTARNIIECLPSAQQWIPFKKRPLTEKEEEIYPEWSWMLDCPTPEDEEDILVSDGKYVWVDTWWNSDGFCRLDSDRGLEGLAWMRFPDPWKGGTE